MNDGCDLQEYDKLKCVSFFILLSLDVFSSLVDDLDFPNSYHPMIQTISREFLETALPSIGISLPGVSVEANYYDEAKFLSAWDNAFRRLREIGCEEVICHWLQQTIYAQTLRFRVNERAWGSMVYDWAMGSTMHPSLALDTQKIHHMHVEILRLQIKSIRMLEFELPRMIQNSSVDDWQNYLLATRSGGVFLYTQIRLNYAIRLWKSFFQILSMDEILVFEKWANEVIYETMEYGYDIENRFSLEKLAKDLQTPVF